MGRTEGKNGSFIDIRMRIHQNFSSSIKTNKQAMPKFLIVLCICGIFAKLLYCGAFVGALMYLKTKTLNSSIISVVFFSCFKKFKCLSDVLDSVTPITICNIEVPFFGCFYNLAQILIQHSIFLAQ